MKLKILDVGQCGFDGPRMAALFEHRLGAAVESAPTREEADALLSKQKFDVILVNRIFAADGASGIEFIASRRRATPAVPIMLVSDIDEAQDQAIAQGAIRGFGKSDLESPKVFDAIRAAAGGKK